MRLFCYNTCPASLILFELPSRTEQLLSSCVVQRSPAAPKSRAYVLDSATPEAISHGRGARTTFYGRCAPACPLVSVMKNSELTAH